MMFHSFLPSSLLAICICSSLSARTWTSSAGVEIEAEYISSNETTVTIRRNSDLRRFTFPLDKLSPEDIQWISEQASTTQDSGDTPQLYEGLPKQLIQIIETRGKLLFEDDFNREDPDGEEQLGEHWKSNSASRAQGDKQCDFVDGAMQLTRSPKANHSISLVHDTSEPYKDIISWTKVKFPKGQRFKIAFNDKQYKPVHAGHINGVTVKENSVTLDDEKNGRFSAAVKAIKDDPSKNDERNQLTKKFARDFPTRVNADQWFNLVTHHDGETLTVYIDGSEVGTFTSPGFGHETKRQIAFAPSKDATVDHIRVWKLKPKPNAE